MGNGDAETFINPIGTTTSMRITVWAITVFVAFCAGAISAALYVYPKGLSRQDVIGIARFNEEGALVPSLLGDSSEAIVAALALEKKTKAPQERGEPLSCPQQLAQCLADQDELLGERCAQPAP